MLASHVLPDIHAFFRSGQDDCRAVMEERVQRSRREAARFLEDAMQVSDVCGDCDQRLRSAAHSQSKNREISSFLSGLVLYLNDLLGNDE